MRRMIPADLVPAAQTAPQDAREIVTACINAGIPAMLGHRALPKLEVLVPSGDIRRAQAILRERWLGLLAQADERQAVLADLGLPVASTVSAPCPACGSTDSLSDGACPDCGLQLA